MKIKSPMQIFLVMTIFISFINTQSITYPEGSIDIKYVDDTTFKVSVKGKLNTWVGIGFGSSMRNVDMHLIDFLKDTTYNLVDAYSQSYTLPPPDVSLGGTDDLTDKTYTMDSDNNPVIEYSRELDTGDQFDAKLQMDTSIQITIAWGPGTTTYHEGRLQYKTITVSVGGTTSDESSKFDFWQFHGITLIIVWTVFNFFGYISSRFLKHFTWWIWMHRVGSGFTALFSIGLLSASISYSKSNKTYYNFIFIYSPPTAQTDIINPEDANISLHRVFGLILFGLIIIQWTLGMVDYYCIYQRKRYDTGFIHSFKNIHRYMGIFLTFAVYINIITGFITKWNNLIALPAVLCALFLSIIIFWELIQLINSCFKSAEAIKEYIDEVEQERRANSESRRTYLTLEQLHSERQNKKYVLYENFVCDVGEYIEHHPGGSMILEDNLYSDVGRYMTGTQAYSKTFNPYEHHLMTHKHVIEKMAYAELRDNHGIVSKSGSNNEMIGFMEHSGSYINNHNISLEGKREIAQGIFEYKFGGISNTSFARLLPGVFWIGRHFSVSSTNLNKTRYYSLCLTLDQNIKEKHIGLLRNITLLENRDNERTSNLLLRDEEKVSNNLHLYIKMYPGNKKVSNHIYGLQVGSPTDLIIRGPCGVGLNLYENKLKGSYAVFAAGTGIIPFIDLISYTLRYSAFKVASEKFNYQNNLLLHNEGSSFQQIVKEDFKLHLFVSFATPETAIFLDVMEQLEEFDKKYNLNIFKLNVRISSVSAKRQRWNSKFIQEKLKPFEDNLTSVLVVGPIAFMQDISEEIITSGVARKEQIYLV